MPDGHNHASEGQAPLIVEGPAAEARRIHRSVVGNLRALGPKLSAAAQALTARTVWDAVERSNPDFRGLGCSSPGTPKRRAFLIGRIRPCLCGFLDRTAGLGEFAASAQCVFDGLQERVQPERHVDDAAVHEESRRATHPAKLTGLEVLEHALPIDLVV
jgi:hypothetical protein